MGFEDEVEQSKGRKAETNKTAEQHKPSRWQASPPQLSMTRRSSHRQNHSFRSPYQKQMRAKFPRTARSQNDDGVRPERPILRNSHQIAAANTKQVPSGSGTKSAPHAARAIGDLISRNFAMRAAALPSGQGNNLNELLTPRARGNGRHG
jgi:hypothetical protein